jgi:DNA-binding CsgD family transcriptional regulator
MRERLIADDEYLSHYCSGVDIIHGYHLNDVSFVKDNRLRFIYVSKGYLNHLYADKPKVKASDIVGRRSGRIKGDQRNASLDQTFLSQDAEVIKVNKTKCFLCIDNHDKPLVISKTPIINPATGNCVGIFCRLRKFMHPHILSLIYKLNGVDFGLVNASRVDPLKYKLTSRQHMVLFLCLNKYSYSEICSIMKTLGYDISEGRVNVHLKNLKYIFGVKSKEQLFEVALSYKYNLFIPRQFLKPGSYLLDDEVIISEE